MSHVGEGSWASFKRTAISMLAPNVDATDELRQVRMRLSDLGVAEFFIGDTGRWRAFRPLLAASPHRPQSAFLCGGRTPALTTALKEHANRMRCRVYELSVDGLFSSFQYHGPVADLAAAVAVEFEPDVARRLSNEVPQISRLIDEAPARLAPTRWTARAFDVRTARWIDGLQRGTVIEYTSLYQERLYLVPRGDEMVELPKREAVYAAAAKNGARLAKYWPPTRELSTPMSAPLPEAFARAACVASGRPSIVRSGLIVYQEVPARLATVLLVSLGHLPPLFHFCDGRPPRRGQSNSRQRRRR